MYYLMYNLLIKIGNYLSQFELLIVKKIIDKKLINFDKITSAFYLFCNLVISALINIYELLPIAGGWFILPHLLLATIYFFFAKEIKANTTQLHVSAITTTPTPELIKIYKQLSRIPIIGKVLLWQTFPFMANIQLISLYKKSATAKEIQKELTDFIRHAVFINNESIYKFALTNIAKNLLFSSEYRIINIAILKEILKYDKTDFLFIFRHNAHLINPVIIILNKLATNPSTELYELTYELINTIMSKITKENRQAFIVTAICQCIRIYSSTTGSEEEKKNKFTLMTKIINTILETSTTVDINYFQRLSDVYLPYQADQAAKKFLPLVLSHNDFERRKKVLLLSIYPKASDCNPPKQQSQNTDAKKKKAYYSIS